MIDTLWDTGLRVEEYKLIWREGIPSSRPVEKASRPPSRPVEKASITPSRPVEKTGTEPSRVTSRQPDRPQPPAGPSRPATSQHHSTPSRPTPNPAPRVVEPIPRPATPPSPVVAKAEPAPIPTQGLNIKSKATPPPIKQTTPAPSAPDVKPPPQASTSTLNIRARATTSIPPKPETPAVPAPPAVPQGLSIRSASTPTPTLMLKAEAEAALKAPSLLSRLTPSTSTPSLTPTTNKRARAEDFTPNIPSQEQPRRSLVDRLNGPEKKARVSSNPEIGSGTPSLLSRMNQQGQASMPSSPKLPPSFNQFTIKRTAQPSPPPSSGLSIKQPTQTSSGLSIKRSGLLPAPIQSPGPGGFSIKNRSTSSTSTPTTQSPIQNQFKIKRTSEIEVQPKVEAQPKIEVQVEDDTPVVRKGRGFAAREFGTVELLITPPNPPKPFNGGRLQDSFGFQKR
jgi:hypothetical protein